MAGSGMGGEVEEEVKDFYGVYLLVSHSVEKRFAGRTYIGYTVNPNRRIAQHNKGTQAGGAKRTSNRGPWKMVLIVHGFPNSISALRFEWAWQQPKVSRRLKTMAALQKKRARESHFEHKMRILAEMLRIGPWHRLPLKIRWLCDEYHTDFPPLKAPPMHMNICYGRVAISKRSGPPVDGDADDDDGGEGKISKRRNFCSICASEIDAGGLSCINKSCNMRAHTICLAKEFLREDPEEILPVEGACPCCNRRMLWGDLIRRFNGALELVEAPSSDNSDNDDDDLEEMSEMSSVDDEED